MAQKTRAQEEPWPLPYLRAQGGQLERSLQSALIAYDEISKQRAPDADSLRLIVVAASDSRVSIYENGAGLLAHLTAQHQAARDAVAKMSTHANGRVRFNALLCLGPETPRDFSIDIVRALLSDKSARVREKAADQALRLGLPEMADALQNAASIERNVKARKGIEFSRAMLKDGYIVKPGTSGVLVTVWTGKGAVGSRYSNADFERRGLANIVNALRNEGPHT